MTKAGLQAPFPYFGGKRNVAELVWQLLGDPDRYCEPFAGSAAVLLRRPEVDGPRVETLNDKDGWLVNMWRAIKYCPEETAEHAAGPVVELDYHARLAWLQMRRDDHLEARLAGDPEWCDPKAAGWWLYVTSCALGAPFTATGPWVVVDGMMVDKRETGVDSAVVGVTRGIPYLGSAGRGVQSKANRKKGLENVFLLISKRLERVRITSGDWQRVLTDPNLGYSYQTFSSAVFLDPPYTTSGDLYAVKQSDTNINTEVLEWCVNQSATDRRIVLCGYDQDNDLLLKYGWRKFGGRPGSVGYGATKNKKTEQLWASPGCLTIQKEI